MLNLVSDSARSLKPISCILNGGVSKLVHWHMEVLY